MLIDFEHPLKSGTMRLWLDDALLIEANLQGRETREVAGIKLEVAGIKLRKGGFEKEVELAPGRHRVRVQVVWEDNQKSDTLFGTFRPGESRRLEIRIGLLRRNLSAEWK